MARKTKVEVRGMGPEFVAAIQRSQRAGVSSHDEAEDTSGSTWMHDALRARGIDDPSQVSDARLQRAIAHIFA